MPSYVPAKRNSEYVFYVGLESVASAGTFQTNPTLASGDVKISKDGGTLANLTTLPTVTPASGKMVKVILSSTEMNADNVTVVFSDASGNEWRELIVNIQTATRQLDDLAYPNTSGWGIDVTAGGTVGIDWGNVENPTATVGLTGTTAGLVDGAITAAKIANDAITDAKVANDVTIAAVTGNVGGNVSGSVASVTNAVTVGTNNDKTGYRLSSVGVQDIWDALTGALATASSIGKLLVDNVNAPISSRLDSGSYTAPDNATIGTIDAKLGVPAANVSADIAAVKGETAAILDDTGTSGVAVSSGGVAAIWAYVVEGATSATQVLRGALAVLTGKSTGGGTGIVKFRDSADAKDRITATVDENGNRTSITLDLD